MIRATRWALAPLLALLFAAPTMAQEAGDRVRVTVAGGPRVVGRFERADADTLVMVGSDSIRRVIPLASVRQLDVAHGSSSRSRRILRGAAIGFGIGAVVGGVLGAYTLEGECKVSSSAFCIDLDPELTATIGAVTLGGLGLLAGGSIGALRSSTRWVAVPGTSRVQVGARRDGAVALGANIRLP